MGKEEELSN